MTDLDYPVAAPANVAPVIYRAQIIQTMALTYKRAADLTDEEAHDAAMATWDTEWESDPAPRSIQDGIDAANSDLEHWDED